MSEWAAKRFWTLAEAVEGPNGYGVTLDGRAVRTPSKAPLTLPTAALADAVAAEWNAQEGTINPSSMPFTRMANSAIDKVTPQHAAVAEAVAAYGDADLLCYRADAPEGLVERQQAQWDPILDWAERALQVRLEARSGLMHVAQAPHALARLSDRVHALGPFELTGFHDLVALSGSLVIGFAAMAEAWPADTLWSVSRLDETWQEEQWGADEEAQAAAAAKAADFQNAARFLRFLSADSPLSGA